MLALKHDGQGSGRFSRFSAGANPSMLQQGNWRPAFVGAEESTMRYAAGYSSIPDAYRAGQEVANQIAKAAPEVVVLFCSNHYHEQGSPPESVG
jgi:hypothetical protein